MPELPEVETIARQLRAHLVGRRIVGVSVPYPKVVRGTELDLVRATDGAEIFAISRRAKMLRLDLSTDWTLLVHLKMTGRLLLQPGSSLPNKSTEAIFALADGHQLFYDDTRRFGYIRPLKTVDIDRTLSDEAYGPEPLDSATTDEVFFERLARFPGRPIKVALLDQRCIVGIGNIYADEALWGAGVHPTIRVRSLTREQVARIRHALIDVLNAALNFGGSSANTYVDLFGEQGTFYDKLNAYQRTGQLCAKGDGGIMTRIVIGGRSTHFCPLHQAL